MINPARCLTLVAVTAVAIGGGWAAPLAAHADVSVYSYVTVISDAGEYVGGGVRTEMWTPGGGSITLDNNTTKVVIRAIDKANRSYAFTFAGPDGERLAVGSYPAAQQAWSPAAGHPGLDVSVPTRYCASVFGEFVVSDVHYADSGLVDRLRLHYAQRCAYGYGEVAGEIALNEPPTDPSVVTVPEAVSFTPTYENTTSTPVHVRLVNEQATPLTVSAVALSGADAAKFAVVGNSCTAGPVPVGGNCLVVVEFQPGADHAAVTAALTFTDTSVAGAHTVPLSASVYPGHTSWDIAGDVDDTVQGPNSVKGSPTPTTRMVVAGTPTSVTAAINIEPQPPFPPSDTYRLTLTIPDGQTLSAGEYPNAANADSSTAPGLNLHSAYPHCSDPQHGSFHIDEIAFDPDSSEVTALSLTFEAHCGTDSAAAYGSIAWHATNPAAERAGPGSSTDTTAPRTPANSRGGGGVKVGYVHLWWLNSADIDWDHTVIREAAGLTPPATAASGTGVYSGRGTTLTLTGRTPGRSYSYSLWGVDTRGNWSAPAHVIIHGTVTILALPKAAPYGVPFDALSEVIDVVTGKAVRSARIHFGARYPGSTKWFGGQGDSTSTPGVSRFPFIFTHSAYVHAVCFGGPGFTGSSSRTVLEPLSPGLTGSFIGTLSPGGTEKISGTILPNLAGHRIYLQRHSGGVWLPYRSMLLSSKSTFGFAFPLAAGIYTFRLYMPAIGSFKPLVTQSLIVVVR